MSDGVTLSAEDVETEETEETEESTEGQNSEEEEWTPPTKAEYNKLVRNAQRAANDLKKLKEAQKAQPSEDDVETKISKAREEERSKAKSRIVNAEAKAKLTAAGAKGDLSRLLRMIDLDDVDVTDDGDVEGLDDEIDRLKTDVPDLFATKVKADPRTRRDAADKDAAPKAESDVDKIAKAMRGGR